MRPLDVARRDQQTEIGVLPLQQREDVEQASLLALVRRPADPEPLAAEREGLAEGDVLRGRHADRQGVELRVSGDVNAVGRSAELERALGLVVGAHHQDVEALQEIAGQAEEESVAGHIAGTEPAVGERELDPGLRGGLDQLGPQLRVLQHQDVRLQRGDGAAAGPRQIVRQKRHQLRETLGHQALTRHRGAGVGDGRNDHARVGPQRFQLADDGDEAEDVARRRAVQPDPRTL